MQYTPFQTYGNDFSNAFSGGTADAISNALTAVATPFSAVIVLWVIVTGVLVMRGQIDTRSGVTRIIRVAFVSAFILEAGIYNQYVTETFQTTLPSWIASTLTFNTTGSTPQLFDQIWSTILNQSAIISKQLNWYQILDNIELGLIILSTGFVLLLAFSVYIVALVMMDVVLAIGPFVIAGFLFEATRGVAERWIGKLIGLSILTLLVDVTVTIILNGEKNYMSAGLANATAASGTPEVAIQILFETTMFIAIGTFIILSLPAVAAAIGGGIALSAAGSVLNAVIGGATGGASFAARGIGKALSKSPKDK